MAVVPTLGWDGSTVLCGHVEDLMCAAGEALEARAVAATGVGLRFAARNAWLAARLGNPALIKRVLWARTAEEQHGLVHLMEADDWVWVQVGEDDWAADRYLAEAGVSGEALQLMHSAAASVMSDVEEVLARVVSTPRGDRIDARVDGMGNGLSMCRTVRTLLARVLFAGAAGVGRDDLDEVLEGKGKLPSRWADSLDDLNVVEDSMEVSRDDASSVGEHLGL